MLQPFATGIWIADGPEVDAMLGFRYPTRMAVIRLTGGKGVDHVIEVGGAGTLAKSFQSVGFRGQITLIGVLSGPEGDTNPHSLMLKNASLRGVFVGSRAMFEEMNEAISLNSMRPVVDRVFPFDEAVDAYAYQLAGKHFGKVVISVQN